MTGDEVGASAGPEAAHSVESLRLRLSDARWMDGEEALAEVEQIAHDAISALAARPDLDEPVVATPPERAGGMRISIGPAMWRRIEALGFVAGAANPVSWLVAEVERLHRGAR